MNKDPFHNLKSQLDRELFEKKEIVSQKRTIMTKIHQQTKRKKMRHLYTNLGVAAAIIFIGAILSSSYLDKKEIVKEPRSEEKQKLQKSTYLSQNEFEEELKKEKYENRRAAEEKSKVKEEESKSTNENEKNDSNSYEEKNQSEESTMKPFTFTNILQNPDRFKELADKGELYGAGVEIGDTYESVVAKFGDLPNEETADIEGGFAKSLGDDYLIILPEKNKGKVEAIQVRKQEPTIKVKQIIAALGEPYFYHNSMNTHSYLSYGYGEYQVTMRIEGLNELEEKEESTEMRVVGVDLGSYVTTVEIKKGWVSNEFMDKEVNYIPDDETMDFKKEWFEGARDQALAKTKALKIVQNDQDRNMFFSIFVSENTSVEEVQKISQEFFKDLTRVSNEDLQNQSLWDQYSYMVSVYKKNKESYQYLMNGFGINGETNQSNPINQYGYPETQWSN